MHAVVFTSKCLSDRSVGGRTEQRHIMAVPVTMCVRAPVARHYEICGLVVPDPGLLRWEGAALPGCLNALCQHVSLCGRLDGSMGWVCAPCVRLKKKIG